MRPLLVLVLSVLFATPLSAQMRPTWIADATTGCRVWNSDPEPGETVRWSGDCDTDNYATGYGVLEWFKDGKPNGRYEGQYLDGAMSGQGAYSWPDGDYYSGEWENNKRHGQGRFVSGTGGPDVSKHVQYEGRWNFDEMDGRGVLKWEDGRRYDGEFFAGKRSGQGVFWTAEGDRYEGEFSDDKFAGRGVYAFQSGARYEGEFRDDKFNGRGVYTFDDGGRYEGEFRDGKRSGRGVYTDKAGGRYEGEYRDGKPNGEGTGRTAGGSTYSGTWTNGCFQQGNRRASLNATKKECGFE